MFLFISYEEYGGITPDFIRNEILTIEEADRVTLKRIIVPQPQKPAWYEYAKVASAPGVPETESVRVFQKMQDDAEMHGVAIAFFGKTFKIVPNDGVAQGYCLAEFEKYVEA